MPSWFAFSLLTLGIWGVWGLLAKVSANYLSPQSSAFFQGLGHLVVLLLLLPPLSLRPELHPKGMPLALLTGAIGVMGLLTFIYALSRGKASIILPLTSLYPVITILLSFLVLRETVTLKQGLGILFALIAIILFSL